MKYIRKAIINKNIIFLLLSALIIRLILADKGTLILDQNTFIAWGRRVLELGTQNFYGAWSDYLPGYIYVLWFLTKISFSVNISTEVLYKLPAIFSDLAVGFIIYSVLKKGRIALLASAVFLFNPAVISNSTLWGQVDILTSLTSLLSVFSINLWPLSAVILAVGVSIKPQVLMAAPLILSMGIANRWGISRFFCYGSIFLLVLVLLFLPFSSENFILFVAERFSVTLGQYPYGSINAFNFWGLWGFWQEAPFDLGVVVLILTSIFVVLMNRIVNIRPYHFLAILFLVNFLFFTRMHERHLLPALPPLAIAGAITPILWLVYVGLSVTYVLNMYYSYQWITQDFLEVFDNQTIRILILANLFLFFVLFKQTLNPGSLKIVKFIKNFKQIYFKNAKIKDQLSTKQVKILLTLILFFSLIVRIVRLNLPENDYFDEIYYVFTARQILAGDPKPWHWSSEHPEGFAYEWTHPPLSKEIMAASMAVFGVNSFAARLPGALAGTGVVFLVYLIARALLKSRDIAVLSAFLISLDGLVLTMSRIGTADIFFVFFALGGYYFFLRKKYFISALFLGFATASKWSTFWFLPVFTLTHILLHKRYSWRLMWYPLIVPLVYLVSYLPMFTFGHDLNTFWGMQKQMWWYHSGLNATHPYTSQWWSWPIMLRPVYLYQNYQNGLVSNIYAIGNPFFFWIGLLAVFVSIKFFLKERIVEILILIFNYVVLFAPWAFSPRIMFIYHYLPSLPFLAIVLGYVINYNKRYLVLIASVLILAFVYFLPHWIGFPIPEWLDKTYYWISTWR